MLQTVGNQSQGQGLHRSGSTLPGAAIGSDSWEGRDVGKPPAVALAVVLNGKCESVRAMPFPHASIMPANCFLEKPQI